jgi:hypothetical protein
MNGRRQPPMPKPIPHVEGGPLNAVATNESGGAIEYLREHRPACHSDTGEALMKSADSLEGWLAFSPSFRQCLYVALITAGRIFAIGFGMRGVAYRLSPDQRQAALAAGASPADAIGPEWVAFLLFEPGRADPDLRAWTERAYARARAEDRA